MLERRPVAAVSTCPDGFNALVNLGSRTFIDSSLATEPKCHRNLAVVRKDRIARPLHDVETVHVDERPIFLLGVPTETLIEESRLNQVPFAGACREIVQINEDSAAVAIK